MGPPKVIQKNKTTKVIEQNIDVHHTATFIPLDSVNKHHSLAYRLNHIWDDTRQVFISCEKIDLKYLTSCPNIDTSKKEKCLFPTLKTSKLYQTTNSNSSEVYEIYCIDAYWAKVKIETDGVGASLIPSRIAQTSVTVKEFDLHYFLRGSSTTFKPLKEPNIKVWKN